MRLALVVMVFGLCAVLRAQSPSDSGTVVRRIAPSDIGAILTRERGKVVLLNIWASWCKPCMEEMPALVQLKGEMGEKKFTLLLVSDDDPETIDSLVIPALKKNGVTFPTYNIGGGSDELLINTVDSTWSGALPVSFLYTQDGVLSGRFVGGRSKTEFERALRKLIP